MAIVRGRDADGSTVFCLWYSGPQNFFGSVPSTKVLVLMIGHVSTAINPVVGSTSNVIVPSSRAPSGVGVALGFVGDGKAGGSKGNSTSTGGDGLGANSSSGEGSAVIVEAVSLPGPVPLINSSLRF